MSTTGGAQRSSPGERSGGRQPSHDGARTTALIQRSAHEVNQPLNCRLLKSSQTPKGADDEQPRLIDGHVEPYSGSDDVHPRSARQRELIDLVAATRTVAGGTEGEEGVEALDVEAAGGVGAEERVRASRTPFGLLHRDTLDARGAIGEVVIGGGAIAPEQHAVVGPRAVLCPRPARERLGMHGDDPE